MNHSLKNKNYKLKSFLFLMTASMVFFTQTTMALSASSSGELKTSHVVTSVKIIDSPQQESKDKSEENSSSQKWVQDGWRTFKSGDYDAAIKIWQQGVSQLNSDHLLLFAGVFRIQAGAIKRLNALGEKYDGIIIQKDFHGSPAFYVLAAPSADRLLESRRHFRENLGVNHAKGRKALFFQPDIGEKTIVKGGEKRENIVTPKPVNVVSPPAEPDVAHLFSMARTALDSGNRSRAMTLLARLLVKQPTLTAARLMYARLWVQEGEYAKAILIISPLLTKNNTDWHPWFWNGTAELMLGHLDQAATSLDEALARDGRYAAPWVQRALVEQLRNHHSTALQMLEMAELSQPGLAVVQLNIGVSSEALELHNRAIMAYNNFLHISSGTGLYTAIRRKVIHHLTVLNESSRSKPLEKNK